MAAVSVPLNSSRHLTFRTWDPAGAATDAGTVALTITAPDGTTTTPTPDHTAATGLYSHDQQWTDDGLWTWAWVASGGSAVPRVSTGSVLVGVLRAIEPWCLTEEVRQSAALAPLVEKSQVKDDKLEQACRAATEWLHSRTSRRFRGLRVVELRPCCQHAVPRPGVLWWPQQGTNSLQPIMDGPASCGCSGSGVELPTDVRVIRSVTIDGAPFTDWRSAGRYLYRTDDENWPLCQRLDLDSSEDDTFAVSAVVGGDGTEIARMAAIDLAGELYLGLFDPAKTRTPVRMSQMTRQGATYMRVDTTTLGKDRLTGLRDCDLFLSEFGQPLKRMAMMSPDVGPLAERR